MVDYSKNRKHRSPDGSGTLISLAERKPANPKSYTQLKISFKKGEEGRDSLGTEFLLGRDKGVSFTSGTVPHAKTYPASTVFYEAWCHNKVCHLWDTPTNLSVQCTKCLVPSHHNNSNNRKRE